MRRVRPPGDLLRRAASRVYSPSTMDRVIDPAVADLQHEVELVRSCSRPRRVAVRARGYAAFWEALLVHTATASWRLEPAGRVAARRLYRVLVWWTVVAFAIATAVLIADVLPRHSRLSAKALACLVPSLVAMAVPFGLLFGTALALRAGPLRPQTRSEFRVVLRSVGVVSLAASFGLAIGTGWVVPASNQLFRQNVYQQLLDSSQPTGGSSGVLAKGTRELTVLQLTRAVAALGTDADVARSAQLRAEWNVRVALPTACIVLSFFGLGAALLATIGRTGSVVCMLVVWIVGAVGYSLLLRVGVQAGAGGAPAFVWLANAVHGSLAVFSIAAVWRRLPADAGSADSVQTE